MINNLEIKNFGLIKSIEWENLGKINVIIGPNSTGKTFLLKAIYTSIKTLEEFRKGNDKRSESEILSDRLYWTYQTEKIGNLVKKGSEGNLKFSIQHDEKLFSYQFGKDTSKNISHITNRCERLEDQSIFIPAKEVLSIQKNLIMLSETKTFGFDQTYYDLALALNHPKTKGKSSINIAESRKILKDLIDGNIDVDNKSNQWIFKKGNEKYSLGVTAEGVKKIAIIDYLLGNRYLGKNSIVFFDEPEASLHPHAITKLLEIIKLLADYGIQIFIATHSYFVIKKLCLIAQREKFDIPLLSLSKNNHRINNLKEGMPENEIINEAVSLYESEIINNLGDWE